jgi:hypothetical protein
MLQEQAEMLKDPNSTQGKVFRRRFRVPYPLFLLYVEWATAELGSKPPIAGRPPVPMTLKVLGVLRILGTGCSTDAVLELSGISESHMSTFFHRFCAWGREKAIPVWVTWPKTTEDIAKAIWGRISPLGSRAAPSGVVTRPTSPGEGARAAAAFCTRERKGTEFLLLFCRHFLTTGKQCTKSYPA